MFNSSGGIAAVDSVGVLMFCCGWVNWISGWAKQDIRVQRIPSSFGNCFPVVCRNICKGIFPIHKSDNVDLVNACFLNHPVLAGNIPYPLDYYLVHDRQLLDLQLLNNQHTYPLTFSSSNFHDIHLISFVKNPGFYRRIAIFSTLCELCTLLKELIFAKANL